MERKISNKSEDINGIEEGIQDGKHILADLIGLNSAVNDGSTTYSNSGLVENIYLIIIPIALREIKLHTYKLMVDVLWDDKQVNKLILKQENR